MSNQGSERKRFEREEEKNNRIGGQNAKRERVSVLYRADDGALYQAEVVERRAADLYKYQSPSFSPPKSKWVTVELEAKAMVNHTYYRTAVTHDTSNTLIYPLIYLYTRHIYISKRCVGLARRVKDKELK